MKAIRVNGFDDISPDEISYYKMVISNADDVWLLHHPKVGLGNLRAHDITEHEDGTITVKPSIHITAQKKGEAVSVHGYLTKGKWRNC